MKEKDLTLKFYQNREAIRKILESIIYESIFSEFENHNNLICNNFGFRPNKNTKDAIKTIKKKSTVNKFRRRKRHRSYNTVNHDILMNILK